MGGMPLPLLLSTPIAGSADQSSTGMASAASSSSSYSSSLPPLPTLMASPQSSLLDVVETPQSCQQAIPASTMPIPNANASPPQQQQQQNSSPLAIVAVVSTFLPWVLFALQLLTILPSHSHLGGLTMFDTILLLIVDSDNPAFPVFNWLLYYNSSNNGEDSNDKHRTIMANVSAQNSSMVRYDDNNNNSSSISASAIALRRPLLLMIGGIVFQAFLFVNFTHALEAISCSDSSSHLSAPFVAVVALNLLAKLCLLLFQPFSLLPCLSFVNCLVLHLAASLLTLALYAAANWHATDGNALISLWDKYFAAALCLLLSATVFPIFKENLPFLLCDAPDGIDADQLKQEIEEKLFPAVRCCPHLHIYRKWPNPARNFTAILHVQINGGGGGGEAKHVQATMEAIHALLEQKGAQKVWIQPWLVPAQKNAENGEAIIMGRGEWWCRQQTTNDYVAPHSPPSTTPPCLCVSDQCQRAKKSCCSDIGE